MLARLQEHVMRPLRYSINVTLDGCVDHRAGSTDEEPHRFWAEKLAQADALLFGRVTYEMMQAAWRWPANGLRPEWMAEWMEPGSGHPSIARSSFKSLSAVAQLFGKRSIW